MAKDSMPKVYKSYEEYAAAKDPALKRNIAGEGDPLERFYRTDCWYWIGEIVEYDGRALPSTIFIGNSMEDAKRAARAGYIPVEFVPEPVFQLFLGYYGDLPEALAKQCADRLTERKKAAQAPAKKVA